jgi:predicted nucleic acid-binding protein
MRVVLDTNILVSALIAPAGYLATIYNAREYDRFTLLTCPEHIGKSGPRCESRASLRLLGPIKPAASSIRSKNSRRTLRLYRRFDARH